LFFSLIGLNYEESYDQVHEMAAILRVILKKNLFRGSYFC